MEKILITGNEGFLGKEIYRSLLNRGCELYGFDSLSGDNILDETNIYGAIAKVDTVIHLAGLPHMPQCNGDPVKAIETNILGTAHVLNACVKHKIERLIYISSAYVFSREGGIYRVTKKML